MKKCALFVLTAGICSVVHAQVPQHIDVAGFASGKPGSQMIDSVVVPVPSEIFSVLDKQGKPAWSEVLRPVKDVAVTGSKEQISLVLGTVIAEGFVAVEAQNPEEVKNIGRAVLKLSQAIGVQKAVVRRSNAIIEAADKSNWSSVRHELDGALADVKNAMNEMRNQDLAQLVSLGGWLRGTQALTAVVEAHYSADGAELLHQPALLDYFKRRLDAMPAKTKSVGLVKRIREGLNEISPIMGSDTAEVSEKTVKQVDSVATELIKVINQKQNSNE